MPTAHRKHFTNSLLDLNEFIVNLKNIIYANRTRADRVSRSNVCSGQQLSRAMATNNKLWRKM